MARRRRSVTAVTTPFDSFIAAKWAKAQHCSFRWDRPPGLASWPVLVPCRTRSTTANLPLCSPAPPPPDSPRYSERSWPTLPAPAPNDRTIHLAKTAGRCFGARQTRAHRQPPAPLVHPSVQNGAIGDRWPLHPGAGPLATKTLPGESCSKISTVLGSDPCKSWEGPVQTPREEQSRTLRLRVWQIPFVVAHDVFVTRRRTGQEACPTEVNSVGLKKAHPPTGSTRARASRRSSGDPPAARGSRPPKS